MNFPKTREPIIAIDVVQTSFGTERVLRLLGQRVIKANELSRSYRKFDIVCYAPGDSLYEYRGSVLCGADVSVASTRTIRFDCVKVYSHPPLGEII
jgi:hypothetical protein